MKGRIRFRQMGRIGVWGEELKASKTGGTEEEQDDVLRETVVHPEAENGTIYIAHCIGLAGFFVMVGMTGNAKLFRLVQIFDGIPDD